LSESQFARAIEPGLADKPFVAGLPVIRQASSSSDHAWKLSGLCRDDAFQKHRGLIRAACLQPVKSPRELRIRTIVELFEQAAGAIG
jgi:hypothetical protein